jgi:hypothetical protein
MALVSLVSPLCQLTFSHSFKAKLAPPWGQCSLSDNEIIGRQATVARPEFGQRISRYRC